MNRERMFLMALGVSLAVSMPAFGEVTDQERVIDVSQLRESLERAAEPIGEKMEQTRLTEHFEEVNRMLEQEELDKRRLIEGLDSLKVEIDQFTADWEETTEPLWHAQQRVQETADRVRSMLAEGRSGEPTEELQEKLDRYDGRLRELAQAIQQERDPRRKEQLEMVFSNVLSLRNLTERFGRMDLRPAQEQVYAKLIGVLADLETQLTATTFQLERARVVLNSQSRFVATYADVLRGLVDAEDLTAALVRMRESGEGLAGLNLNLDSLQEQTMQFEQNADRFMEQIAANIEGDLAQMGEPPTPSELEDVDIQAEIDRYAGQAPEASN